MSPGHIDSLLEKSAALRAIFRFVDRLDRHDAFRAASAVAFDAFLSLIPLAALAGYVLARSQQGGELLLGPFARAAPGAVSQLVDGEFIRLTGAGSSAIPPLGVAAFLWVSSAGVATALGVCEVIFGAKPRPWWLRRALAIGFVIAGLAVVVIATAVGLLVATAGGSTVAAVVASALPAGLLVAVVAGFFRLAIPQMRRPERGPPVIFGAVVAVGLWGALTIGFSFYVGTLARYATLYGNLATVAILLFWLWLLALSLLAAAEVIAMLDRSSPDSLRPPPSSQPASRAP